MNKLKVTYRFTRPVRSVRVVIEDGQFKLHGFDAGGECIAVAEMPEEYCYVQPAPKKIREFSFAQS